MDKASKMFRRSSVRLRALSGGHSELNLVISELANLRTCFKSWTKAQQNATEEMSKWAQTEDNRALRQIFAHLSELNAVWTEVQNEFSEHTKQCKGQFQLILEGEKEVDTCRNGLITCEQNEEKLKKDLQRAQKKGTAEEVLLISKKLEQAVQARMRAELNMTDIVREKETMKMVLVKKSLQALAASYLEMAHKCCIVFEANHYVTSTLPDMDDENIQNVKCGGAEASRVAVAQAKDRVCSYGRVSGGHQHQPCAPVMGDPPPPYSANSPSTNTAFDGIGVERNSESNNHFRRSAGTRHSICNESSRRHGGSMRSGRFSLPGQSSTSVDGEDVENRPPQRRSASPRIYASRSYEIAPSHRNNNWRRSDQDGLQGAVGGNRL